MRNRFIIIVLCLCLILGDMPTYKAKQTENNYDSAVSLLSAFDMINRDKYGNFPTDVLMTRAEFCGIVSKAAGLGKMSVFRGIFSDVAADSQYALEIEAMYDAGYVCGDDDAKFFPDEYISFDAAVKILVNVLGYTAVARAKGGYPTGYLIVAKQIKLTYGIISEDMVTNGVAAKLIRNAIEAPTCEVTGISNDGFTIAGTGDNLLYLRHNVMMINDIFNSDMNASLSGVGLTGRNTVTVGNVILKCDNGNNLKYLGCIVNAYYDADTKEIIYCEIDEDNEILTISSDSDPTYSSGVLSYYDENSNRMQRESIPSDVQIIYNGKNLTRFSEGKFAVNNGKIELVDNDSDGKWDVVKIYEYTTFIVDSLDYDNNRLYVKNSADSVIYLDNTQCEFYDADGNIIDYSYITPLCALSALISDDAKVMYFYKSSKVAVMKVVEITDDNITGDNGETYGIAPGYTEFYGEIGLGDSESFLIDIFGNICGKVTGVRRKGELAYMLATEYKELEKTVYFAAVTERSTKNKKRIIIKSDERIKIDGDKYKPSEAETVIQNLLDSETEKIVMLFYDSDERVTEIDTLNMGANEDPNNSLCLDYNAPAGSGLLYRETSGTFGGKTVMAKGFKVFYVPLHEIGEEPALSGMDVRDYRSLSTGENYDNFSTYKIGKDNLECIAMVRNASATDRNGSYDMYMSLMLIESLYVDKDPLTGDSEKGFYYYYQGVRNKAFVADSEIANELESGDIVMLSFDADGYINDYRMVYDAGEGTVGADFVTDKFDNVSRAVLGYVYAVRDGIVLITESDPATLEAAAEEKLVQNGEPVNDENLKREVYAMCEKHRISANIGEYDKSKSKKNRFSPSGEAAIRSYEEYGSECSKMLLYTVYSSAKDMYIFPNYR